MSDELLDALASDLAPRPARRVGARLALALAIGAMVSFAAILALLGPRANMAGAAGTAMFWTKLVYPVGLAAVGVACVERLARPAGAARRRVGWLVAPVAAMAIVAAVQWVSAPPAARRSLLMGHSAMICPWLIVACAIPIFLAMVWALRGLAPTRLRAAGAMAGLSAGGTGAALYALHCGETGGAFVLVWYSLGVLLPAAAGAVLGPILLRWR